MLCVPKVERPDYPGCDLLKTVSKDELIFAFCECPFDWGEHQFTYCSSCAKGPLFLNMVMTFFLHPLSHYNSIIEPRAQFWLSFLEHHSIDFPSHFIFSIIDVYRDSVTRDKLIFPSAITRILRYFYVPFPMFDHFPVMGAIDTATVKRSEAQFRSRRSWSTAPPTSSTPSTSAPSSSTSGVTLKDIMAQLQRMDARLDTLNDELYQVNTHVGCIARQQAVMGGFVASPPPTLEASEGEDHDDDATASGDEDDGDASSSSVDKMST